jgi:acyl-CoA thioester hydrolase
VIHTEFIDNPAAKIHLRYKVFSQNTGILAATGETIQVFLDNANELCITNPEFFVEWKKEWQLL